MSKNYEVYTNITKKVLDSVQVGDLVKCNHWKLAYRVKGVSANYFVMARNMFGQTSYSICEKKPREAGRYNAMTPGMYHIGPDSWIFGWRDFSYNFDNFLAVVEYLDSLERGETEISERRGCALYRIAIKKG